MLGFQGLPQFPEQRRQVPVAKDIGMIQGCRLAPQHREIVQGVEDHLALLIATSMPGDDLVAGHDSHLINVALDCHRAEGPGPRHAVAIAVELHRLILVHLGRLLNAGVKGALRQG